MHPSFLRSAGPSGMAALGPDFDVAPERDPDVYLFLESGQGERHHVGHGTTREAGSAAGLRPAFEGDPGPNGTGLGLRFIRLCRGSRNGTHPGAKIRSRMRWNPRWHQRSRRNVLFDLVQGRAQLTR